MMIPSYRYNQHCLDHHLSEDPCQQQILPQLDRIHKTLIEQSNIRLSFLQHFYTKRKKPVHGLYIWGGIGRGKTMLMDMLYDSTPVEYRLRQHFHHFMLHAHQKLTHFKKTRDPLSIIAKSIAEKTRLLCLDEFHVNDIADAMILAGLLRSLFNNGVTLVTTSNIQPDQLYVNGLQRARFLPAIKSLLTHTDVVELASPTDYRLRALRQGGTYHHPLSIDSTAHMAAAFASISSHARWAERCIEINDRELPVLGQAEGAVWFDFKNLCDSPRSQNDYIEISKQHHSVFISNIPILDDNNNDAARRLLNLLDIFYDSRVKLIISATTPIEKIYSGKRLQFEFERATSRLIEMQSEEYLSLAHRTS